MQSYHAGVGFAHAKANLESLNRCVQPQSLHRSSNRRKLSTNLHAPRNRTHLRAQSVYCFGGPGMHWM